ncbi:MAG: polysaccharide deacetylase family protein [Luteitalea sp.]
MTSRTAAATLVLVLALATALPAAQVTRRLAITIDDLPWVNRRAANWLPNAQAGTARLLDTLRGHGARAVVFVNEGQLAVVGERQARTALLESWVAGGHTLANHTYSHADANRLSIGAFKDEISKGERVSQVLMAGREPYQRYFRHPMTHTGDSPEKKAAIDAFLAERGVKVAPHTIENADWLFNGAYVRAVDTGDQAAEEGLRDAYLTYSLAVTEFAELASVRVFGREIPQTLLIHSNAITADRLDLLLTRLASRGYRFVTLDEAMTDAAYRTADAHVSRHGPTWLFRWSRSLGQDISFAGEPEPPDWVTEMANRP